MPTATLNWEFESSRGTYYRDRDALWAYIGDVADGDNCSGNYVTYKAVISDACITSISLPLVSIYPMIGTYDNPINPGQIWYVCEDSYFTINGDRRHNATWNRYDYFSQISPEDCELDKVNSVTIRLTIGSLISNSSEGCRGDYMVADLPSTIDYTTSKSAPSSTSTINLSNSITISGTTYYITESESVTSTISASGGCPPAQYYNTYLYKDGTLIDSYVSFSNQKTYSLPKSTFSNPYRLETSASNNYAESSKTTWHILSGAKPSINISDTVARMPPGGVKRITLTGYAYGESITPNVTNSGDVVTATLVSSTLDSESGYYECVYDLAGVFTEPSETLSFYITDSVYGNSTTVQLFVEIGIDAHYVYEPLYPLVGDTVSITNTSSQGTSISYTWKVNGVLSSPDWSLTHLGNDVEIVFSKQGIYTVELTATYGDISDTFSSNIDIGKSSNASEPRYRYKIAIFRPDTREFMFIGRTKCIPVNNSCTFYNLKFGYSQNQSAPCTFKLIGANTITSVDVDSLLREGSKVAVFDDNTVVWSGIITDIAQNNTTSPYNNTKVITNHDVTCMDASYELMLSQYTGTPQTVTNTIPNIISNILPINSVGSIGYSDVTDIWSQVISFSYSNTDRYSLMNQLLETTSWSWRNRPNIVERMIPCQLSGLSATFTSTKTYNIGDIIFVNLGYYEDAVYHPGMMVGEYNESVAAGEQTFTFNPEYVSLPQGVTSGYVTILRQQSLYDVAPSFYQYSPLSETPSESAVRTYITDRDINNVTNSASVNDKYGIVSVTARDLQDTQIYCTLDGFMEITPNFTVPSAYVITKSIDSYITSMTNTSASGSLIVGDIYLKGWTLPTSLQEYFSYEPIIYYFLYSGIGDGQYRPVSVVTNSANPGYFRNISRVLGQNREKYTKVTYQDSEGALWANTYQIGVGTVIVGSKYELNTTDGLSVGDYILIGNEPVRIVSIDGNIIKVDHGQLVYPNHNGHMVGTMVFKISSLTGYTSNDIEPNSPIDKYGNSVYSAIGPNGLTVMELEAIAQNILRFGSNYMDNGRAKIPLMYFGYNYEGTFNPLRIGDHISILPSYNNPNAETEFEVIGYEVNADRYMVDITYGMPVKSLINAVSNLSKGQVVTFNTPDYQ